MESDDGGPQGSPRTWLLRALEAERGAVEVYAAALRAFPSGNARTQWVALLDDARKHEQLLTNACRQHGIDPDEQVPGRDAIAHLAASLVIAIEMALRGGDATLVQRVGAQCAALSATWRRILWAPTATVAGACRSTLATLLAALHEEVAADHGRHAESALDWWRQAWPVQGVSTRARVARASNRHVRPPTSAPVADGSLPPSSARPRKSRAGSRARASLRDAG